MLKFKDFFNFFNDSDLLNDYKAKLYINSFLLNLLSIDYLL